MILRIVKVLKAPKVETNRYGTDTYTSKTKVNYGLLLDGKAVGVFPSKVEAMRARSFLLDHERGHYVARQQILGNNDAQTNDVLLRDVYIDAKHALQLIFPDQSPESL